jgi:sugar lactone lactonase YvrE
MAGAMLRFDLDTGAKSMLAPFEADKPGNRPNDGRVDPTGGFWIGSMGRANSRETAPGAVYQYKAGGFITILRDIKVPNSTCFSPDGRTAYFTDAGEVIRKCPIDPTTGLPVGEWSDFAASPEGLGHADGSVVDSEGYLWSARWGGSAVVRFAPDGHVDRVVTLPVSRVTCPAFGGADLRTLYITTAREGLSADQLAKEPHAGSVFALQVDVPGLPETVLKP